MIYLKCKMRNYFILWKNDVSSCPYIEILFLFTRVCNWFSIILHYNNSYPLCYVLISLTIFIIQNICSSILDDHVKYIAIWNICCRNSRNIAWRNSSRNSYTESDSILCEWSFDRMFSMEGIFVCHSVLRSTLYW